MNKKNIIIKIEKILKKNNILDKKKNFLDLNIFKDENIDSMKLLFILTSIEKEFKLKFKKNFFNELDTKTIAKLSDYILKNKK